MSATMWTRLKTFRRNAGLLNSAAATTALVLLTLGTAACIATADFKRPLLLAWPALFAPWLVRNWLVQHPTRIAKILPYGWVLLIVLSLTRPKTGFFPHDQTALVIAGSLYLGTFFWLYSDPRLYWFK